jgi:hypothetical protein
MIYKIAGIITLTLALFVCGAWNLPTTVSTERTFNASEADALERSRRDPEVVGAEGIHRTRRPERRATRRQLSLGDEIRERTVVLDHRNL